MKQKALCFNFKFSASGADNISVKMWLLCCFYISKCITHIKNIAIGYDQVVLCNLCLLEKTLLSKEAKFETCYICYIYITNFIQGTGKYMIKSN